MPPLIKISSPTAAEVCQEYQPSAGACPSPNQTPAQHLATLRQNHQSEEAIKFLAHGMPERESTWWAVQSAKKAGNPANLSDQAAIQAAETWVRNPNPATQQQAALAAARTDYQTPGAWAAQAAAWSEPSATVPPVPTGATLPGSPAMPRLTPQAVSGAVMLAAAMSSPSLAPPSLPMAAPVSPLWTPPAMAVPPAPALPPTPQQRAQTAKIHQPFLDLGTEIASGTNTWA